MKALLLVAGAVGSMAVAPQGTPTGASVVTVGGSAAESCYEAAEARDASQDAMADCNSAIHQQVIPFNDLVASYVNRGVLKLVRGDNRSAEADFNQAMALQPNQAEAWLNKGIARYQQGDPQSAVQHFSRAIELKTSYLALAYYGRGIANEDSGDVRAAYRDLRKAASLKPKWDAPLVELKRYQVDGRPAA